MTSTSAVLPKLAFQICGFVTDHLIVLAVMMNQIYYVQVIKFTNFKHLQDFEFKQNLRNWDKGNCILKRD